MVIGTVESERAQSVISVKPKSAYPEGWQMLGPIYELDTGTLQPVSCITACHTLAVLQ